MRFFGNFIFAIIAWMFPQFSVVWHPQMSPWSTLIQHLINTLGHILGHSDLNYICS